jgi:hypothetical protein
LLTSINTSIDFFTIGTARVLSQGLPSSTWIETIKPSSDSASATFLPNSTSALALPLFIGRAPWLNMLTILLGMEVVP